MFYRPADPAFHRPDRLLKPVSDITVGHALIIGEGNTLALIATQMGKTVPQAFRLVVIVPVILFIVFLNEKLIDILLLMSGIARLAAAKPVDAAVTHNVRQPGQRGAEGRVVGTRLVSLRAKTVMQHLFGPVTLAQHAKRHGKQMR